MLPEKCDYKPAKWQALPLHMNPNPAVLNTWVVDAEGADVCDTDCDIGQIDPEGFVAFFQLFNDESIVGRHVGCSL